MIIEKNGKTAKIEAYDEGFYIYQDNWKTYADTIEEAVEKANLMLDTKIVFYDFNAQSGMYEVADFSDLQWGISNKLPQPQNESNKFPHDDRFNQLARGLNNLLASNKFVYAGYLQAERRHIYVVLNQNVLIPNTHNHPATVAEHKRQFESPMKPKSDLHLRDSEEIMDWLFDGKKLSPLRRQERFNDDNDGNS